MALPSVKEVFLIGKVFKDLKLDPFVFTNFFQFDVVQFWLFQAD